MKSWLSLCGVELSQVQSPSVKGDQTHTITNWVLALYTQESYWDILSYWGTLCLSFFDLLLEKKKTKFKSVYVGQGKMRNKLDIASLMQWLGTAERHLRFGSWPQSFSCLLYQILDELKHCSHFEEKKLTAWKVTKTYIRSYVTAKWDNGSLRPSISHWLDLSRATLPVLLQFVQKDVSELFIWD